MVQFLATTIGIVAASAVVVLNEVISRRFVARLVDAEHKLMHSVNSSGYVQMQDLSIDEAKILGLFLRNGITGGWERLCTDEENKRISETITEIPDNCWFYGPGRWLLRIP